MAEGNGARVKNWREVQGLRERALEGALRERGEELEEARKQAAQRKAQAANG